MDVNVGLRPINTYADVVQFLSDVKGFELVDLYVEHNVGCVEVLGVNGADKADAQPSGGEVQHEEVQHEFTAVGEGVGLGQQNKVKETEYADEAVEKNDGVESDTPTYFSESEDEDYVNTDEEEGSESDVSLDDSDYDEAWDWTLNLPPETLDPPVSGTEGGTSVQGDIVEQTDAGRSAGSVRVPVSSRNPEPTTEADFFDEDGDS